ncbi:hypothetical protein G6700_04400 [Polynucleobacter paneuropaeus]|nr:hypothetical protein G6700_04400 [Polynucleobacter paneuropaeus]
MKTYQNPLTYLIASTCLVASLAYSQTSTPADKPMVIDAAVTQNQYQLFEGDVLGINYKTRTITFKNKDGVSKFVAGPEVKNFNQLKKGDHLSLTYELGVAIDLIKTKSDGVRSKVETTTLSQTNGDKPSEKLTNKTTIIADIVAVDREKKLVSVKGPSGKVTTVSVTNSVLLNDVNVGEQVKVVYTDAMAASITRSKK